MEFLGRLKTIDLPEATYERIQDFLPQTIQIWLFVYFINYFALSTFMWLFFNSKWKGTDSSDRHKYFSSYFSTIHSAISFLSAIWGLYYSCSQAGLNFFNSAECRSQPSSHQMWANLISMGYFIVDMLASLLLIRKTNRLAIQHIFHHILGIIGTVVGCYMGGLVMKISHATMVVELTNPFLNFRNVLFFHNWHTSPIYYLNGVFILVTYTIARVIFQGYLVF